MRSHLRPILAIFFSEIAKKDVGFFDGALRGRELSIREKFGAVFEGNF